MLLARADGVAQRLDDLVGRGPPGGVGIERAAQRLRGEGARSREVHLAGAYPAEDGLERADAERRTARDGERERGCPAPPVPGGGRLRAVEQLGREVARGTHDEPVRREPGVGGRLRDPEVDQHGAVLGEEDVGRLDVAVDESRRVDGPQRSRELLGELEQVFGIERAATEDLVLEARAVDELHDDERLVAVRLGVEDGDERVVADLAHRGDLAQEAVAGVGRGRVGGVEDLERDLGAAAVLGDVDRPGRTCAERPHDRVAAYVVAGSPLAALHNRTVVESSGARGAARAAARGGVASRAGSTAVGRRPRTCRRLGV